MTPQAASAPYPNTAARRSNVSQACINCRQRKKKCDGRTPVCSTCETYKDDCVWTNKTDWRKSVSRAEANSLRTRVAELEAMLAQREGSGTPSTYSASQTMPRRHPSVPNLTGAWGTPSSPNTPPTKMARGSGRGGGGQHASGFGDGTPSGISNYPPRLPFQTPEREPDVEEDVEVLMVQDSRGMIRIHGPSSAFRHRAGPEPDERKGSANGQPPKMENDSEAWRRFLPDFFLTKAQHDLALDRFFRYFTAWAQRATPHLFYRDLEIAVRTPDLADLPVVAPNYSPALHNVSLALGLAFMPEEHLRALCTRTVFMKQANKFVEDFEITNACVATVQAVAICGSFYSTSGQYSMGWMFNGISGRLCYALGLHLNTRPLVAKGKLSHEMMVQRDVTFWSWYSQEVLWGIYIGRYPMLQDYTVPHFTADPVTDDTLWTWPPGPREHLPPQKTYLSLTLQWTLRICQMAIEVTRRVHTARADKYALLESGTVQRLNDELDLWLATLPAPLQVNPGSNDPTLPHILMINLAWAWTVIILNQPFSQVVSPEQDAGIAPQYQQIGTIAMTRSHQAAIRVVQLSAMWDDQHSLTYVPPTLPPIIYSAGTTFLLAAAQAPNDGQAAASLRKVHQCLEYLQTIARTWESGKHLAYILEEHVTSFARASLDGPTLLGDVQRGWRTHERGSGTMEPPVSPTSAPRQWQRQKQQQQQDLKLTPIAKQSIDGAARSLVPSPGASGGYQPAVWSEDTTGFDQFISSLLLPTANLANAAHTGIGSLEGFA